MTDMMVRPTSFEFPPPVKTIGGLLDIVTVKDGIGFLDPPRVLAADKCLRLDAVPSWPCPLPGPPDHGTPKDFVSPDWQDGIRFAVYGGGGCKGPAVRMGDAPPPTP